MLDSNRS